MGSEIGHHNTFLPRVDLESTPFHIFPLDQILVEKSKNPFVPGGLCVAPRVAIFAATTHAMPVLIVHTAEKYPSVCSWDPVYGHPAAKEKVMFPMPHDSL